MTVPDPLVWIAVSTSLGIQGWTLREVIKLKVDVATLTANQNHMKPVTKKALFSFLMAVLMPLLLVGCGANGIFRPVTETNSVTHQVTTNGFIVNPAVSTGLDIAQKTSGFIPSPIGEGIAIGASLLSGLLGWTVRRKNRMLTAVVNGVERTGSKDVKETIADAASLEGVLNDLHKFVQLVTRKR